LQNIGKQMCVVFYENVLKSKQNFGFVYVKNSKVLGFIFGTEDSSKLLKNPRILFGLGMGLIKKPILIKKIFPRFNQKLETGPEVSYVAIDLRSIAMLKKREPDFRDKRIGDQMGVAMKKEFKRRGFPYLINWIEENNKASLAFSLRNGSKIVGEFWEDGKRTIVLRTPTEILD
jgi:ribosomal protein S18 acetylase RimI-like enzyme